MKLQLGTKIKFTNKLERIYNLDKDLKEWLPVPCVGEGILVGYRTKQNGNTEYIKDGDGYFDTTGHYEWCPSSYVYCALVYYDLRRNPIFVPLESMVAV